MFLLAGWLLACFVLSIFFANKPYVIIAGAAALRILVPWFVSNAWMPGMHMAGYLVTIYLIMQAVFYWPRVQKVLRLSFFELSGMVILVSIMMISMVDPYASVRNIIINIIVIYIPGFVFYILMKMEFQRSGMKAVRFVAYSILAVMVYEIWLAIQQNETGEVLVYTQYISKEVGWTLSSEEIGRSKGTVESGLELSALSAFAISLTYWVRNSFLQVALMIGLVYSCLLGTGRAALAVAIVISLLVVFLSQHRLFYKISSIVIMGFATLFIIASEAGQTVISKIEDDGSSSELRFEAYKWVARNYQYFILGGYPGERDFRSSGQLGSSIENAYLIASVEYGLIFGVTLLLFQILIVLQSIRNYPAIVAAVGALGVIAVNLTNSGFTTNSMSAYLLWIAIGFTAYNLKNRSSKVREKVVIS